MYKKLAIFFIVVLLSMIGISKAGAHTVPFKPYDVSQDWYKAGGTLSDIWPQSTTVITCGGIKQHDEYTIDNAELDKQYKALIAGGVLNGQQDDAKFHPHNYTVTLLPICQTPKPDVVYGGDSSQNCDGIETRTWHNDWTWDGTQWVASERVIDTDTHRDLTHQEALDEGCITDEPTPTPSDTPTDTPTPSDTPSPSDTPTTPAPSTSSDSTTATITPVADVTSPPLAFTGANVGVLLIIAILVLGVGGILMLAGRHRKHN